MRESKTTAPPRYMGGFVLYKAHKVYLFCMTIAFTGGGTGGHFYPIIAIAEAVNDLVRERRFVAPKLYYLAPDSFDQKALFENGIIYIKIPAGKMRRYTSFRNITDLFITLAGTLSALFMLFRLYPDIVMSKGGYGSVPTVLAARLLGIPVIIHESDAKPGRANLLAAKWAAKIAISFESAAKFFPDKVQDKIARTGIPIRKALAEMKVEGARQYLGLEKELPTILILGGSQGAVRINDFILDNLVGLLQFTQIFHQTGRANYESVVGEGSVVGRDLPEEMKRRYKVIDYLEKDMRIALEAADLVISRAGSGSIFEIAAFGKPSILIPLPDWVAAGGHQEKNAREYRVNGAAVVIEEENLLPNLFLEELKTLLVNPAKLTAMSEAAKQFAKPDAALKLAQIILRMNRP